MINYNDITTPYVLASELDVLVFDTQSELSLAIAAVGGSTVLSCSYVPVGGVVKVYDLDRLLSPMIEGVMADFTFTVDGASQTLHVVQSRARVSEATEDFLAGHFLSSVFSGRDTALGRKEMVTLLSLTGTVNVTAACVYADGETCVLQSVGLASSLASGVIHEVDCSPSLLVNDELGTLVQYTVNAGDRLMTYRVSPTATTRTAMLMRNDFGAWEPCYFTGMVETAPSITREFVMIGGEQRSLRVDEQENLKSYTGPLRPGSVQLMRALARSTEVVLLEDGNATGDDVVITDQDVKYTDEDGHLPAFTFTWHRASHRSQLKVPIIPRLFDDTFDDTFN